MNKKLGAYIFLGLIVGSIFGTVMVISNEKPVLSVGFGAVAGALIGWVIAIVSNQNSKRKKATQKARRRR
ncbi:MAG: hypothetical protein DWQ07_17100 [Chloroflexi bacterium]|nr:MAG: hypothetical protein DWQ07_17100 [Chloroflexota bacterium]MBL1195123.1 hypothetical protein [Chloroflexota bacterium]NOH12408.1 hypothetical protein [Chloroflexota bacterium]